MKYDYGTFVKYERKGAVGYGIVVEDEAAKEFVNPVKSFWWDYVKPIDEFAEDEEIFDEDVDFDDWAYINCQDDEISCVDPLSLPNNAMESYISEFMYEEDFNHYSSEKLEIIRALTEHLIETDSSVALQLKGYCSYEGNALYPQDWTVSRDCLLKDFENNGSPQIANSLGYIAYYGRCNNGEPQYSEAFRYFSYGAASDVQESMYKLADMIYHGLSVPKNRELAKEKYNELYEETKKEFLMCPTSFNKFADCALRMCQSCLDEEEVDWYEAKKYALEAELSLSLKPESFGDDKVKKSVQEKLKLIREKQTKETSIRLPNIQESFLSEDYIGHAVVRGFGKKLKVTFSSYFKGAKPEPSNMPILLTIPELDYCGLVKEYSICTETLKKKRLKYRFFFDELYLYMDESLTFTNDVDVVQSLEAERWIIEKPQEEDLYEIED